MPQGIGKLRDRVRARFPRTSRFIEHWHTTLSVLAILGFVSMVGYIGYSQHETESTVTRVQGDVNVIKQQSSCSPRAGGGPQNRKQCTENFDTIIHKILTPLQACEFLERGSPLIRIGGKPIPKIECAESPLLDSIRDRKQQDDANPGQLTTGGSGRTAPETQSTSRNTESTGGGHTGPIGGGGDSGGKHGGTKDHNPPASPPPAPEPPAPEGPGASGGAGKSDESNANGQSEENPATENKLLPDIVGPVEGVVCNSVAGQVVCK